ncbi:hypothetical protein L0F63_004705, partial [Massospora cicadina]
ITDYRAFQEEVVCKHQAGVLWGFCAPSTGFGLNPRRFGFGSVAARHLIEGTRVEGSLTGWRFTGPPLTVNYIRRGVRLAFGLFTPWRAGSGACGQLLRPSTEATLTWPFGTHRGLDGDREIYDDAVVFAGQTLTPVLPSPPYQQAYLKALIAKLEAGGMVSPGRGGRSHRDNGEAGRLSLISLSLASPIRPSVWISRAHRFEGSIVHLTNLTASHGGVLNRIVTPGQGGGFNEIHDEILSLYVRHLTNRLAVFKRYLMVKRGSASEEGACWNLKSRLKLVRRGELLKRVVGIGSLDGINASKLCYERWQALLRGWVHEATDLKHGTDKLARLGVTEVLYRRYFLTDDLDLTRSILLMESKAMVASGTTGLRTWYISPSFNGALRLV